MTSRPRTGWICRIGKRRLRKTEASDASLPCLYSSGWTSGEGGQDRGLETGRSVTGKSNRLHFGQLLLCALDANRIAQRPPESGQFDFHHVAVCESHLV